MTEQVLHLKDGRVLGYALYGPEKGQPVLYFHGTPSSRLEPLLTITYNIDLYALLEQYHIRLIAFDRPGMGISSFDRNRSFFSVINDAQKLLQYLGYDTCQLLCWSGGGPYALAMAYHFPNVVKRVNIVAAFSNSFSDQETYDKLGWNKMYFNTARRAPLLLQAILRVLNKIKIKSPISQWLYDLSNPDYALMKPVDKINGLLNATVRQAVSKGAAGAVQEAQLYFKPLGFTLPEVKTPVHFWWGTEDNIVTYIHAKHLEQKLPDVVPHYKPGEGHLSVYVHYFEEVLQTIAAAK